MLALLAGSAMTIGRSLSEVPGLTTDTWAMVTAFSDFGLVAYLVALPALIAALLSRFGVTRVVVLAVALVLAVLHASWIVPRFIADTGPVAGPERITVLAQNLLFGDADPRAVVENAATADVLVLVEMTEPAVARLTQAGIESRFPYAAGGPLPQSGPTGTRIYSRLPILESRMLNPAGGNHNWLVRVDAGAFGPLTVVAAHPTRPVIGGTRWLREQENLRTHLPRERTVVTGDLNAVNSHLPLRRLAAEGLRGADEIVGVGWQPTFPTNREIPPLITIDHILLSPDLTATAFRTVAVPGSDHRGVLATVALRG